MPSIRLLPMHPIDFKILIDPDYVAYINTQLVRCYCLECPGDGVYLIACWRSGCADVNDYLPIR